MLKDLRVVMRSDIDRYEYLLELDGTAQLPGGPQVLSDLRTVLLCKGLQASLVFRVGHALVLWQPTTAAGRIARIAGRAAHWVANRVVEARTGIQIAERAQIGRGLYIAHFGGIIIGVVIMGENCNLSQGVTMGRSGRRGQLGRPTIGDRAWIGPGAVVTGGITMGEDSVVGANSVVTSSVPARSTTLGAPSRTRTGRGSFDMVVFRGAEDDPRRSASLQQLALEQDDAMTVDLDAGRARGRQAARWVT